MPLRSIVSRVEAHGQAASVVQVGDVVAGVNGESVVGRHAAGKYCLPDL